MESARSIIDRLDRDLSEPLISKQQTRRIEAIELVRTRTDREGQALLFTSRPFLLCGLPLRRPPAGTLLHKRKNGSLVLKVCADPEYGLPFGQDRLIPIWVASQAVRHRSRQFSFASGATILDEFGLPPDGPHYRRLLAGFKRVFTSTIFFGTEDHCPESRVWESSRFAFFDSVRLWTEPSTARGNCHRNTITLSEPFWQEVNSHPIPVDRDVVRALANAPGTLDFYMWLSWRSFGIRHIQRISLLGNNGLISQLGSADYSRPRDFRRTVQRWIDTVSQFWSNCPARISSDGLSLHLSPSPGIHRRG